jgi:hypothetical protein
LIILPAPRLPGKTLPGQPFFTPFWSYFKKTGFFLLLIKNVEYIFGAISVKKKSLLMNQPPQNLPPKFTWRNTEK